MLFVRIFLFNPNPFTPYLLEYYPKIQSKKAVFEHKVYKLSAATVCLYDPIFFLIAPSDL